MGRDEIGALQMRPLEFGTIEPRVALILAPRRCSMRRSFRFLAVLACALPLACSDPSTTPTAPAPVPRVSANPASNGSVIVRFNDWTGWWWVGWYDAKLD